MDEIVTITQRLRESLQERYGAAVEAVILYGSYARGEATEDSDIDLLVVVDDRLDPWKVRDSLDDFLLDVLLNTDRVVSVIVAPKEHYEQYQSPFAVNVRREGILV
jgi:predicted nucleotidyltransferase